MIRLENVVKVYPDGTRAVDDVSLEVPEGEICILVGPSGCGKTTTMKMINRLIPITEGRILIGDQDIYQIDQNELRRNVGYVIQEIGLFPHMTVRENIETVPVLKGWSKKQREARCQELLELMDMDPDEFLDSYPSELSGGQRQRVGVARAMGADPDYLLMDEPFGAIDPITRERLQDMFLRIQAQLKKTIIFVTHDINEAIKMGDKIALMRGGKLVQYDDPATLLAHPADRFVRDFVGTDRTLKQLRLIQVRETSYDRDVPVCRLTDKAEAIHQHMSSDGLDYMVVVDDTQRVQGWLLASHFENGSLNDKRVQDLFNSDHQTIQEDEALHEALSVMLDRDATMVPVVDSEGHLKGLLTFATIQRFVGSERTGHSVRPEAETEGVSSE